MTRLLVDTSVLIKWFHEAGESDAHVRGDPDAHVLDLAVYEVGNLLARALPWAAADVAGQLDDLTAAALRVLSSVRIADCLTPALPNRLRTSRRG